MRLYSRRGARMSVALLDTRGLEGLIAVDRAVPVEASEHLSRRSRAAENFGDAECDRVGDCHGDRGVLEGGPLLQDADAQQRLKQFKGVCKTSVRGATRYIRTRLLLQVEHR
jgi:hypothetical protein